MSADIARSDCVRTGVRYTIDGRRRCRLFHADGWDAVVRAFYRGLAAEADPVVYSFTYSGEWLIICWGVYEAGGPHLQERQAIARGEMT